MPETRVERGLFVLGLAAIAVLGFLVVHLWQHRKTAAAAPPTTSVAPPPTTRPAPRPTTTAARRSRTATTKTTATTVRKHSPAPAAKTVSLRLTAKNGTWFEIRSESATGPLLYGGTLPAGLSKAFRARALWARFGAAGNLSAQLDGKTLSLPSGTYSATFDRHGFRQGGG